MKGAVQTGSNTTSSENINNDPNADLPKRWEVELEFVQSLANMQYLSYLVQHGYLKDQRFINYLSYLTYWKDPQYSKHIVYPDCLHILTLLQSGQFRSELSNTALTNALFIDMVDYWKEEIYKDEKSKEKEKDTEKNDEQEGGKGRGNERQMGNDNDDKDKANEQQRGDPTSNSNTPFNLEQTNKSPVMKVASMSPTSTEG